MLKYTQYDWILYSSCTFWGVSENCWLWFQTQTQHRSLKVFCGQKVGLGFGFGFFQEMKELQELGWKEVENNGTEDSFPVNAAGLKEGFGVYVRCAAFVKIQMDA